MSRIGNKHIDVPAGVEVKIDGHTVTAKGPNGTLTRTFDSRMEIQLEGAVITVKRPDDSKECRSLHGLTRTLIANMVEGVHKNFTKELEINGVGYRAAKQGSNLVMNLGFSHQVIMPEIPDKQKVGQFAAEVREKRPPEPYKGKGIKYVGEVIIRKEGKAGKGKK